jgi:hypothetical protein
MAAGAHLEEDVGGVEVAVADALAVNVGHALGDVEQDRHRAAPVPRDDVWVEKAFGHSVREAPAVAVLLRSVRAAVGQVRGASPNRPRGRNGRMKHL